MEKEKLERISHLSRLSRERNLTDEETKNAWSCVDSTLPK